MAEGINLRSGEIDLPPYPFVRYYFDWGAGSPRLTYVWPLIASTASTLGAFVLRRIPSLILYCTQDSRKTLRIWLSIPKFG